MALVPPVYLDCVLAIGFGPEDNVQWSGTGFLYFKVQKELEGGDVYGRSFLVTNKHVIEGQESAWVRCNPSGDAAAKQYGLGLTTPDGDPLWFGHPDPDVDIAVLPVDYTMLRDDGMQVSVFFSNGSAATHQVMLDTGISEGDGVFVLGFPMAMVGAIRNVVIVRAGTIARIRDLLAGHSKTFLIDASVFPGNSGGPVILKPEIASIAGTKTNNRSWLLGIVCAYVPYQDTAYSLQTKRPRVIFEENTGLAVVHPTELIEETIHFQIATMPPDPNLTDGEALTQPSSPTDAPEPLEGQPGEVAPAQSTLESGS